MELIPERRTCRADDGIYLPDKVKDYLMFIGQAVEKMAERATHV
jgi:hypothetical protein